MLFDTLVTLDSRTASSLVYKVPARSRLRLAGTAPLIPPDRDAQNERPWPKEAHLMKAEFSRRKLIQAAGAAALPFPAAAAELRSGLRHEGVDTPKICLEVGVSRLAAGAPDEAGARRVKQLGVDHVIARYP